MIEYTLIGKTSYDGKIYFLKAEHPWEIPAIRIYVSSHFSPTKESKGFDTLSFIEYTNKGKYDSKAYVKRILSYFHGDIGEMGNFAYYLKDISRLTAFLTWIPIGAPRGIPGVGTEKSLRYLSAKGFVKNRKLEEELFEDYHMLRKSGVKKEDARVVLPLSTSTELILQMPPGRSVEKWANTQEKYHGYLKEMKEIAQIVKKHNREFTGYSVPLEETSSSRFTLKKRNSMTSSVEKEEFHFDKVTNTLKAFWKAPIFSAHQDVRNRQVYHYWPSWEEALEKKEFYIPSMLSKDQRKIVENSYNKSIENVKNLDEDSLYAIPLGMIIPYSSVISGKENIKYTIALRTCWRAQFEIRSRYWRLAKFLEKNGFEEKLGPRCVTEGQCFEPGKEKCPLYNHFIKKNNKTEVSL